jgi:hypothetical protein
MKNAVFCDVTPCRSCVNRPFGGTRRHIPEDGILQLVMTFHKSPSSTGHSRLLTTLLLRLNCQILFASRYIVSGRTIQKTQPLPSNGCPLLLRIRCSGMCLLTRCLAVGLCVTMLQNFQQAKVCKGLLKLLKSLITRRSKF